jgi:hypothetical protein
MVAIVNLVLGFYVALMAVAGADCFIDNVFRCDGMGQYVVSYAFAPWTLVNSCDRIRYEGEVARCMFRAFAVIVYAVTSLDMLFRT